MDPKPKYPRPFKQPKMKLYLRVNYVCDFQNDQIQSGHDRKELVCSFVPSGQSFSMAIFRGNKKESVVFPVFDQN